MKSMLNIGNDVVRDESSYKALAEAIVVVLQVAEDTHTDETTVRVALGLLREIGGIQGTTISNCQFTGPVDSAVSADGE